MDSRHHWVVDSIVGTPGATPLPLITWYDAPFFWPRRMSRDSNLRTRTGVRSLNNWVTYLGGTYTTYTTRRILIYNSEIQLYMTVTIYICICYIISTNHYVFRDKIKKFIDEYFYFLSNKGTSSRVIIVFLEIITFQVSKLFTIYTNYCYIKYYSLM